MYGRFLTEAVEGESRLAGMGTELTAIGDLWEQVAAAFGAARQRRSRPGIGDHAGDAYHAAFGRLCFGLAVMETLASSGITRARSSRCCP